MAIEALLTAGGPARPVYPDSGPGPTTLKYGDETLGLFGTLTQAEFLTPAQLIQLTNSPATSVLANPTWTKMFLDGKIVFIPSQPISSGTNWEGLYNAGLVYGDMTVGKYPPSGGGVLQDNIIAVSNSMFIVRLFGRGEADPSSALAGSANNQLLKDFELGRFIAATYSHSNPQLANSWNLYSGFTAWSGTWIPTIPSYASNVTQALYRYVRTPPPLEIQYAAKNLNNSCYWWPVLELLPKDSLIAIGTPKDQFFDNNPMSKIAIT